MKYPRPEAPRTRAKRIREERRERGRKFQYEIVRKEVHGQMVDVKVYKPWWAQGDKNEAVRLGLDRKPNRFSRGRGKRELKHRASIPQTGCSGMSTEKKP